MSDADLDLLAAYAAGALDGPERAEAERLLDRDPAMRAGYGRHLDTLASLADDAEVPPGLLDRILADLPEQQLDDQPPITRDALSLSRRNEAHHPTPAMTPPAHLAPVSELADARRERTGRLVRTILAAAAVAGLLLVGIGLATRDDPDGLQDLATAALADPDARVVDLAVPETTDAVAQAAVFADGAGYLVIEDLPALPAGETYQLWMLPAVGTDPISLGLVDLAANGGTAAFQITPDAAGVALSREPAGGSVVPTEVVAAGTFA